MIDKKTDTTDTSKKSTSQDTEKSTDVDQQTGKGGGGGWADQQDTKHTDTEKSDGKNR